MTDKGIWNYGTLGTVPRRESVAEYFGRKREEERQKITNTQPEPLPPEFEEAMNKAAWEAMEYVNELEKNEQKGRTP